MALDSSEFDDDPIELDKLEIPTIASLNNPAGVTPKITEPKPSAAPRPTSKIKGRWWKLSIVMGVLILAAVFLLIFEGKDINLPFYSNKASKSPANYLKVGPVTATIGNNDIIRMTVEINCKNKKIKNKMMQMDSVIRDRMVNVLNKPDTKKLLESNDYNTLRLRMKKDLSALMPDQAIEDIYFSEFLTY